MKTIQAILLAAMLPLASGPAAAVEDGTVPPPNPPGSGAAIIWPDLPYDEPARDDLDAYGGWTGLKGTKTGFFHAEQLGGRWWLVTPEGNAFYTIGLRGADPEDAARFKAWGFNATYGGSGRNPLADAGVPYVLPMTRFMRLAPDLPIPPTPGFPPWVRFYDVFHPDWPAQCEAYAEENLKPLADDPYLIGYFIGNEPMLHGWLEGVLLTAPDAPARKAFVEVARRFYADKPGRLEKDWQRYNVTAVDDLLQVHGKPPSAPGLREAWDAAMAERAFSVVAAAGRKAAPNHMNMGVKMINNVPPSAGILSAMGKYCDVVSMNFYNILPDRLMTQLFTILPAVHGMTQRPIISGEFSFRGPDTLCPNTIGAPPTMLNQTGRGIGYLSYLSATASMPFFVGGFWYVFRDDAADVDWDRYAEDCNFGVVDYHRRPYAVLTETMRVVNGSVYELAADPVQSETCPLFWRTESLRWDRDWDREFLRRLARLDKPFDDPFAQFLPEDRRFHPSYWVRHVGPRLRVNDDKFLGFTQANLIRELDDGAELALLGIQGWTSFPRGYWFGKDTPDADRELMLESNAQLLTRRLDRQNRLRRMTLIDGSYLMLEFSQMELRINQKVPYLDLRYDHDARTLHVTTRGRAERLGLRDVGGWRVVWNGVPVQPVDIPAHPDMTVFRHPDA